MKLVWMCHPWRKMNRSHFWSENTKNCWGFVLFHWLNALLNFKWRCGSHIFVNGACVGLSTGLQDAYLGFLSQSPTNTNERKPFELTHSDRCALGRHVAVSARWWHVSSRFMGFRFAAHFHNYTNRQLFSDRWSQPQLQQRLIEKSSIYWGGGAEGSVWFELRWCMRACCNLLQT